MESRSHARRPSDTTPGIRSPERVSVYEIYRQQIQCLAALPGQVSEFFQNEFGYEWRCQFDLEDPPGPQLQFSLVDMEAQQRPAAVLYLVDSDDGGPQRLSLSMVSLDDTHEQLNRELIGRGVSVGTLEQAQRFMSALVDVRESLGESLDWT